MAAFEPRLLAAKEQAQAAASKGVEARLLIGSTSGQITGHAAEQRFDLIALGTHGRTGISRLFLGSVAEKVVRTAPCPVLAVRLDQHEKQPRGKERVTH